MLTGVEEERAALERRSVREHDALELPVVAAFEERDLAFMHGNLPGTQFCANLVREIRRTVGQEHDVAAPLLQHERQARSLLVPAAIHRERPITPFPAVTVR